MLDPSDLRLRLDPDALTLGGDEPPLAGRTRSMWCVGQTVRVALSGGSPRLRDRVREVARRWTAHANLDLDFVGPGQAAEVRATFAPGASWCHVGRDALWVPGDRPTMTLGGLDDTTPDGELARTVLHQFGYALGLRHEHRPPPGGVPWHEQKARAYFRRVQGWDDAAVEANVFARYAATTSNYAAFDPLSIMRYPVPAELTRAGASVRTPGTLSPGDEEHIARWYPPPSTPGGVRGTLRTHGGLDEIGYVVLFGGMPRGRTVFSLLTTGDDTRWKAVDVPVGLADHTRIQSGETAVITTADLDRSRPVQLWRSQAFGIRVLLRQTWDLLVALPDRCAVRLVWRRDRP